jgi:DNA-binding GntR family transcriptional regulator
MSSASRAAWAPVTPTTLGDQVFERLRERILRGDLAPGEFVREQEVSEALGVSRTPVRHALARLAAEGFLERLPNRGYRIPEEPIMALLELYPIITALELLAGRLSMPHLTRTDIAKLRQLNRRLERSTARHDLRAGIDANHEFHRLLSRHCGNRKLMAFLDDLRKRVARLEYWSTDQAVHAVEAVAQHDEIVRTIEDGRFDDALLLLERNRLQTYDAFLEEIGPSDNANDKR